MRLAGTLSPIEGSQLVVIIIKKEKIIGKLKSLPNPFNRVVQSSCSKSKYKSSGKEKNNLVIINVKQKNNDRKKIKNKKKNFLFKVLFTVKQKKCLVTNCNRPH